MAKLGEIDSIDIRSHPIFDYCRLEDSHCDLYQNSIECWKSACWISNHRRWRTSIIVPPLIQLFVNSGPYTDSIVWGRRVEVDLGLSAIVISTIEQGGLTTWEMKVRNSLISPFTFVSTYHQSPTTAWLTLSTIGKLVPTPISINLSLTSIVAINAYSSATSFRPGKSDWHPWSSSNLSMYLYSS